MACTITVIAAQYLRLCTCSTDWFTLHYFAVPPNYEYPQYQTVVRLAHKYHWFTTVRQAPEYRQLESITCSYWYRQFIGTINSRLMWRRLWGSVQRHTMTDCEILTSSVHRHVMTTVRYSLVASIAMWWRLWGTRAKVNTLLISAV